jgi:hypothetical protein
MVSSFARDSEDLPHLQNHPLGHAKEGKPGGRTMKRATYMLAILMSLQLGMRAQTQTSNVAAVTPQASAFSTADIVKLSKAGLSDEVIVQKLKKNGQAFDLSSDQMIELKSAGVSDKVVAVMLDPAKPDITLPATVGSPKPAGDLPEELGIYSKRQDTKEWAEVMPEVINWKTGGYMKSVATYGIVKGDVNGHLQGKESKNVVTTRTEFLIVAPEGVAISEYQLLKMHQNSNNREFRSTTGGVFHASGGATRDAVQFEGKKISPRHFLIVLSGNLTPGEYGLLPPGAISSTNAAGSTGKIYSFKVLE